MEPLDVYPALVYVTGRRYRQARLSIRSDGSVRVFRLANGSPKLEAESVVASYETTGKLSKLTLANGETWTVQRTPGCGCGGQRRAETTMRAFDPWAA